MNLDVWQLLKLKEMSEYNDALLNNIILYIILYCTPLLYIIFILSSNAYNEILEAINGFLSGRQVALFLLNRPKRRNATGSSLDCTRYFLPVLFTSNCIGSPFRLFISSPHMLGVHGDGKRRAAKGQVHKHCVLDSFSCTYTVLNTTINQILKGRGSQPVVRDKPSFSLIHMLYYLRRGSRRYEQL